MKIDLNRLPDCSEIERIELQNESVMSDAEILFDLTTSYAGILEMESRMFAGQVC